MNTINTDENQNHKASHLHTNKTSALQSNKKTESKN